MTLSRRTLLQYGALAAGTRFIPSPSPRHGQHDRSHTVDGLFSKAATGSVDTDMMLSLAHRAVEAATASGATYADVRLTHTLTESYTSGSVGVLNGDLIRPSDVPSPGFFPNHRGITLGGTVQYGKGVNVQPRAVAGIPTLVIGLGVRAFVQGYWGFASSPYWTDADAVRLGQDAAVQAMDNARAGQPKSSDLAKTPIVQRGQWIQPGIDPFAVPVDEKLDVVQSLLELPIQGHRFANSELGRPGRASLSLWRETRVFASSEGASYTQVRYRCMPGLFLVSLRGDIERGETDDIWPASWPTNPLPAYGWEFVRDLDQAHMVDTLLAQARREQAAAPLGIKPVEIGKYDIVFGASATADFVYHTLGIATELDRAMGYEANASGTSYLGPDPMQYLGTAVASPQINLSADRTTPHALATAQWDDEGMPCRTFPLIKNGILVDYQTTREQAHWLADWYEKNGMSIQSRACAIAETALDCPIQMSPNFTLEPGPEAIDVDDLVKDTERGVYFPYGVIQVDQQVKNGIYRNSSRGPDGPREIRNGKLGPVISGAGVLFSSREFWKNVMAIGGAASAQWAQAGETKGEPRQRGPCNVRAVPMKVKDCAIIDARRKA